MADEIDKKPVFCIAEGKQETDQHVLIIGLPAAAWEYMKDGKTTGFSLVKAGIPFEVILFGAESHDACMSFIKQSASANNIALLDKRAENNKPRSMGGDDGGK